MSWGAQGLDDDRIRASAWWSQREVNRARSPRSLVLAELMSLYSQLEECGRGIDLRTHLEVTYGVPACNLMVESELRHLADFLRAKLVGGV
jgi:hypothetical protein